MHIITSCNFLTDQNFEMETEKTSAIDRNMDKYLTRREKYMYERILAKVNHGGSLKRVNAALVILQKIMKGERSEQRKAQKLADESAMKNKQEIPEGMLFGPQFKTL